MQVWFIRSDEKQVNYIRESKQTHPEKTLKVGPHVL